MLPTNIFVVLGVKRHEEPHDRILHWLCNPAGGHGIARFAASLIEGLWDVVIDEPIRLVKRQYRLADDSWPDLGIEFEKSLLIVENKVNVSALKAGQLERQHELGMQRQKDLPFFHVLLCPDRLPVTDFGPRNSAFRILNYSRLAAIIRSAGESVEDAFVRSNLLQYADFALTELGAPAPRGVRLASARAIANRNTTKQIWTEQQFLERAEKHSDENLQSQIEFLDLIRAMESVEPRFDSVGPTNATYKVYISDTDIHPLWIYEDGKLYIRWSQLRQKCGDTVADSYKAMWEGGADSDNKDGFFLNVRLSEVGPVDVARKLQLLADQVSALQVQSLTNSE